MLAVEWIVTFLMLGSFVGFMAGLLGVGGGGIMVPVLATIFLAQGVMPDKVMHLALGTSMASIVMTSFASLRAHHANKAVLWSIVRSMSVGIIVGTFCATFIVAHVNSFYLALFFSMFMLYVSSQMLRSKKPSATTEAASNKGPLWLAGTGIGAISALVSIGGGSLSVPYLTWRGIDIKKAIGTSAAIGLPISLSGSLGYLVNGWNGVPAVEHSYGFVYLPGVILISLASFFTAPLGANMASRLPVAVLKKVFAILLILLSAKMFLSII